MSNFELPEHLIKELTRMRRVPAEFSVVKMIACSLGCGKGTAYSLTHTAVPDAGSWCPIHGWLYFASSAIAPIGEQHIPKRKIKRAA